jgi:hypothetical protein
VYYNIGYEIGEILSNAMQNTNDTKVNKRSTFRRNKQWQLEGQHPYSPLSDSHKSHGPYTLAHTAPVRSEEQGSHSKGAWMKDQSQGQ